MFQNSLCAHSVLDVEGVDGIDFGADTSTRFIPLRSGLKIQGVNNWGNWESLRCASAQQEYNEIQKDPVRYGTPVRCTKVPIFAFQIRGVYPNKSTYVAGSSRRCEDKLETIKPKIPPLENCNRNLCLCTRTTKRKNQNDYVII